MGKVVYMNKGALHKALFDSHHPDPPRLVQIADTIDALAQEAARLRREQELTILADCQRIVEREADRRARRASASRGGTCCNDFFSRFSI